MVCSCDDRKQLNVFKNMQSESPFKTKRQTNVRQHYDKMEDY